MPSRRETAWLTTPLNNARVLHTARVTVDQEVGQFPDCSLNWFTRGYIKRARKLQTAQSIDEYEAKPGTNNFGCSQIAGNKRPMAVYQFALLKIGSRSHQLLCYICEEASSCANCYENDIRWVDRT